MRIAILADIHSNLEALEAVLRDVDEKGPVNEYWCLGDIVGYGPDPQACLAIVREKCRYIVAGNHDMAAAGAMDTSNFNDEAAQACIWTANQLGRRELNHLKSLELDITAEEFTLVHGSPRDPVWEYLVSVQSAKENFSRFETPYCLVGHSHIPLIFEEEHNNVVNVAVPLPSLRKLDEKRLIINPGSVGQSRDGDWRASYMIYDSQERTIELRRLSYNVTITQEKMRKAGLSSYLIERLSRGL